MKKSLWILFCALAANENVVKASGTDSFITMDSFSTDEEKDIKSHTNHQSLERQKEIEDIEKIEKEEDKYFKEFMRKKYEEEVLNKMLRRQEEEYEKEMKNNFKKDLMEFLEKINKN